jgi:hypothetical protein
VLRGRDEISKGSGEGGWVGSDGTGTGEELIVPRWGNLGIAYFDVQLHASSSDVKCSSTYRLALLPRESIEDFGYSLNHDPVK